MNYTKSNITELLKELKKSIITRNNFCHIFSKVELTLSVCYLIFAKTKTVGHFFSNKLPSPHTAFWHLKNGQNKILQTHLYYDTHKMRQPWLIGLGLQSVKKLRWWSKSVFC